MTKLTQKEADEARQRGLAYEHSLAIEGIPLTDEEKRVFDYFYRERMGYDEQIVYVIEWCRRDGLIPADYDETGG